MKFTVQPGDLKSAFAAVKMALSSSKNSMPVLDNIKIEPTESETEVKLTASDGDNTIVASMAVDDAEALRPVLVPAEFLYNFIGKAMGEWPVTFEFGENGLITVSDLIGEFNVVTNDTVDYYPVLKPLNEPDVITLSAKSFVESSVLAIGYAEEDSNKNTCGVNYTVDGDTLIVAATDAKKLFYDVIHGVSSTSPVSMTLTKKPVSSIIGLVGMIGSDKEIKLSVTKDKFCVESEKVAVFGVLREAKFPKVASVLPKKNERVAIVDNKKLAAAIERVSIASSSSTHQIIIAFNGANSMKIESEDIEFSRSAHVTCETISQTNIDNEYKISFRGDNLQRVLSSLKTDATVALLMGEPTRAALIKSNPESERQFLLMPMQIIRS